ncbi:MAG: hypothetical protein EZS28_035479, partial [Streblomastix strix]
MYYSQNVDQNQQPHLTRLQSFFGSFDQSITNYEQSNNSIILAHNKYENKYFGRTELKALKKVGNKQNQFNSQDDWDDQDKFGQRGEQFQWEGEQFYYNHLALFGEMGDGDDYEDWARDQKKMQQQGIQAYGQQYKGQLSNTSSQYGYGYSGMQTENKTKYSPSELADMMLDQNQLIQQQMVDPSYLPPLDRYSLCKPQGDQDYLKYKYEATILPNTDLPTDEQLQEIEEDDEDAQNQNPDLNLSTELWGTEAAAQDLQQSKKGKSRNDDQSYWGAKFKINLKRLFARTEAEQILELTEGSEIEYVCNRKPQIDITRGFSFPVSPQLQMPPYPVISEYYTTTLPPPINVATQQNQLNNLQEEFMNDEEKMKKQIAKMYTNNETLSISFVNRNGYGSMVSSFFDPKVYFGEIEIQLILFIYQLYQISQQLRRPAIICEFYAPIVKNDAFEAHQAAKKLQEQFNENAQQALEDETGEWMPRDPSRQKDDAPGQFRQQKTDGQGFILNTELRELSTAKPAAGRRAAATDVCERVPPEPGDRSTGPRLNNRNTRRGTDDRDNSSTGALGRAIWTRSVILSFAVFK